MRGRAMGPKSSDFGGTSRGAAGGPATVSPDELPGLLYLATRLAEEAGALLLTMSSDEARATLRDGATRKSSRTDLATEADRESERLIRSALAAARPDDGILGEEGGTTRGASGLTWVVDPLDGTINFVYGFPAWSVSIALVDESGSAIVGVVHDPELGETFRASRGHGASLDGDALHIGPPPPLAECLVATGFGYAEERRHAQASLLPRLLPAVRDVRRAGSAALDLCWVACGRLDAFYEAGLSTWDFAAGVLIAEEAGAASTSLSGIVPGAPTLVVGPPDRLPELVALLEGREHSGPHG